MPIRDIRQIALPKGARILLRVDFNVVLRRGRVLDDFRMRNSLPTIRYLLARGFRLRILAHFGRPKGKRVRALSLRPIARHFRSLLKRPVRFVEDPFDSTAFRRLDASPHVLFFENLRFWHGEEECSTRFAGGLSRWGDAYVNEAFPDSHRPHASLVALPRILPAYAGFGLYAEVRALGDALRRPRRPFLLVLGGAKVSTKLPLIRRFLPLADRVIIAGALANAVFRSRGIDIGRSTAEQGGLRGVPSVLFRDRRMMYPTDARVEDSRGRLTVKSITDLSRSDFIGDIGPATLRAFVGEAQRAKTILWNGPLGYTDDPRFERGSAAFARALGRMRSFRVVGGGETVAVVRRARVEARLSHVSTGGGAMLEFLSGKALPGLEALKSSKRKTQKRDRKPEGLHGRDR